MPTIPAASPSRPSTRLTALAMPTTHSTVITGIRSADSTTVVPAKGSRKNSMLMPKRYSTVPGQDLAGHLGRRRHLPEVVDHARR